jgi:hypothetical protein
VAGLPAYFLGNQGGDITMLLPESNESPFWQGMLEANGNHRWYIFLDIQLRFSYIQLTQKRVLIIYLTF